MLSGSVSIDVSGRDGNELAHLCFSQQQRIERCADDGRPVSAPLVADRTQTIGIGQRVECCQCLALSGCAADAHAAAGGIIDIGHSGAGAADNMLSGSVSIDVTGRDGNDLAYLRFSQQQRALHCTDDRRIVSAPLVADRTQTIGIGQRIGGCQRLALGGCAADAHAAAGGIIDIGHSGAGTAGNTFNRSIAIRVAGGDGNYLAYLSFSQLQRTERCTTDGRAVSSPLVADASQTIGIGQRIGGCQRLALAGCAADAHAAAGGIIEIGHRRRSAAGNTFDRALPIGVACAHRDGLADFGLCWDIGGADGAADRRSTRTPLVVNRAQAVSVMERTDVRAQVLVLSRRTADGYAAGGRIVDGHNRHDLRNGGSASVSVSCGESDAARGRAWRVAAVVEYQSLSGRLHTGVGGGAVEVEGPGCTAVQGVSIGAANLRAASHQFVARGFEPDAAAAGVDAGQDELVCCLAVGADLNFQAAAVPVGVATGIVEEQIGGEAQWCLLGEGVY